MVLTILKVASLKLINDQYKQNFGPDSKTENGTK
jgi:hypothetical protein